MTAYNTHILDNGLRIIHLHSASPVVYLGYEIKVGTRDELPTEEGIAHLCEHATFKGTVRRTSIQILKYLDKVGGDINAFTNKEDTVYHAAVLKEHTPRAIDLLTDIVFNSTYPQNEIEKEIKVVCDEIESYNDSPADLIYDEFENLIFEHHPLGHSILGNANQLSTYTTEHVSRFTRRYYTPGNAVFFVYGDVDFKAIIRMLQKATSGLNSTHYIMSKQQEIPIYNPREVTREINSHQAHVMIGNRAYGVHNDKRIALYLLNNILGGIGMSNRLNIALRERHGLVYTVESSMVSYADTGVWAIYFGCDPTNIATCKRLIRKELEGFMNKLLGTNMLNTAKEQIKGQIGIGCDNRESFAIDFAKSYLHYGWEKDIPTLFRRIDDVTPEQIQTVAQEIFAPESLTTLTFR